MQNYIASYMQLKSSKPPIEPSKNYECDKNNTYMLDQFKLALQNGLHGRLSPMVVQQRNAIEWLTPPPHAMDGSDTRNNRPIQSLIHDGCNCPWSLFKRMSLPNMFSTTTTPPSPSDSSFACEICVALHKTSIDHYTRDCWQYICTICKKTQAGHYPADSPERCTWLKGLQSYEGDCVMIGFITTCLSCALYSFLFFSFSCVRLQIHARYTWTMTHATCTDH